MFKGDNIPLCFGVSGLINDPYTAVIKCEMSVDNAVTAVDRIFLGLYRLNKDTTYRLWVKGMIDWRDKLVAEIDTSEPSFADWKNTLSGVYKAGKPYKYYQARDRFSPLRLLTFALGRAIWVIKQLFRK